MRTSEGRKYDPLRPYFLPCFCLEAMTPMLILWLALAQFSVKNCEDDSDKTRHSRPDFSATLYLSRKVNDQYENNADELFFVAKRWATTAHIFGSGLGLDGFADMDAIHFD
ncbi:MAG: hypothetical protein JNM09_26965 [Blastocatellia bacterium]|nr:hypothetical protein [Blastocatellia bacterium]